MKRLSLIIILLLVVSASFAQRRGGRSSTIKWLSIAVRGGGGTSLFFNSNVLNDTKITPSLSPGFFYGGRLGLTIGDNFGFSGELLQSTFAQGYGIVAVNGSYSKDISFSTTDYSVLFRYTSKGFFAEVGPMFSTMRKVTETNDIDLNVNETANTKIDRTAEYSPKPRSLTAAMGMLTQPTDRIELAFGVKANYSMGDIVAPDGQKPLDDGMYVPGYATYGNTSPLRLYVMAELNYFFGFWGDASCGRGRLMLFK